MSKSKKNYVDPNIILDHEGADALRWYLMSANAPWMSTRFYEDAVKDSLGKFILTLWNSYNFFATYATLDAFDPAKQSTSMEKRSLLDQWILSRYHQLISRIRHDLDAFEIHRAARALEAFIVDDFSNWYLRRSRKRLWVEEMTDDKQSGYSTMYDVFLGLTQLLAPFIPFITEEIYANLKTDEMPESVHLCDYPTAEDTFVNPHLEEGMDHIRRLVESGRALRAKIGIKVRYPLKAATLVCSSDLEKLIKDILPLLQEELNVKTIHFSRDTSNFMVKQVKPNHANLGPRLKQQAKDVVALLESMDRHALYQTLQEKQEITLDVQGTPLTLTTDDFVVVEEVKPNVAQTETEGFTLFFNTELSPELEAEGLARELVRRIQSMRKDMNLDVEEKITVEIGGLIKEKQTLLSPWQSYIKNETRAQQLCFVAHPKGPQVKTWTIDDLTVEIGIATS